MKKIAYRLLIVLSIVSLQNCNYDSIIPELDYITFSKSTYSTGVDPGGSTTLDVIAYTTNIISSDRSYAVTVDPTSTAASGSFTVPASITIPAGSNEGTLTIAITDTNLGIGVNKLVLKFEAGEGYYTAKSTTVNYVQNCSEITATIDFTNFDQWGSEVLYEIYDSLGTVVLAGSGWGDRATGTYSETETITLCAGRSYTFLAYDGFGDSWGPGSSYTLTINGVVKVTGDGSILDQDGVETGFNTN
jgi:hypothetical protein